MAKKDDSTKPQVKSLRISEIRLDFQPYEYLIEFKVDAFVARQRTGDTPPPLKVRFDGQNYFLEDGFHRLEAAKRCGISVIDAEIVNGALANMEAFRRPSRKK